MEISNLDALSKTIDEIVDCIDCAVNTILVRRFLHPRQDFFTVKKYNVVLLKTHNLKLKAYVQQALSTLRNYLFEFQTCTFVVVIMDNDTKNVLERWQFIIRIDDPQQPMSPHPYNRVQEQFVKVLKYIHVTADCLKKPQMQCTFKMLLHPRVSGEPLKYRDDFKDL